MNKVCKTCGSSKDESMYYVHAGHISGECKECAIERSKKHRLNNLESVREKDRNRKNKKERTEFSRNKKKQLKETNPDLYYEMERLRVRKYRENNQDKHKAHGMVNNAIRDGKLTAKPCERCQSIYMVEAHHPDYSKPLDVIWLCDPCHKEEHKRLRKIEREKQKE